MPERWNSHTFLKYKLWIFLPHPNPLKKGELTMSITETIYAIAATEKEAGKPKASMAIRR